MTLPSRNIVPVILIAVALIGATLIIQRGMSRGSLATNGEQNTSIDTDTDGDGLKDWEEGLWKTDPNKADTDGDGTNDSDEIREGRDPVKAGPDDLLPGTAELNRIFSNSTSTASATLAKELLLRYTAAKQAGVPFDQEIANSIIESSLGSADLQPNIKVYSLSDIKTNRSTGSPAFKTYGNRLASAITLNSPYKVENEYVIVTRAIYTDNAKELEKLSPIIKGYKQILAAVLTIDVPAAAAPSHLEFVNSISAITTSLESLQKMFDDPARGAAAYVTYTESAKRLTASFLAIKNMLIEQKVSFQQSENGYAVFGAI